MIYLLHRTCWREYETKTNHIPSTYHSTHGFKGMQTHFLSNIQMLDHLGGVNYLSLARYVTNDHTRDRNGAMWCALGRGGNAGLMNKDGKILQYIRDQRKRVRLTTRCKGCLWSGWHRDPEEWVQRYTPPPPHPWCKIGIIAHFAPLCQPRGPGPEPWLWIIVFPSGTPPTHIAPPTENSIKN